MATMQAEIVHHEKCDPTYRTVGYAQDCWEDTETGKLYSEVECTNELNPAYAVTYKKLKSNPASGDGELQEDTERAGCPFNWAKYMVIDRWDKSKRTCEFKVHGLQVDDARLKFFWESGTAEITLDISVNGNSVFHIKPFNWSGVSAITLVSLPELKNGDVVRFEFEKNFSVFAVVDYAAYFTACLEYTSINGGDPNYVIVNTDDKRKFKGTNDPELTYNVTPSYLAEKISGINISRDPGEELGSYTIHASQEKGANPDYEIHFPDEGKLEIVDGVYHKKGDLYGNDGLVYIKDCWEETATGKYYVDDHLQNEITSGFEAVVVYPEKLKLNPITATDGFTVKESATYEDVSFDWVAETKYNFSDSGTRYAEFTVKDDVISTARLKWYMSLGQVENGPFTITVYVNNNPVKSFTQDNKNLTGSYSVFLPGLKHGDVVKFEVYRPSWVRSYDDPLIVACLEYLTPHGLCLIAQEDGSTVQLNKVGNPYDATLEYCTSTGRVWQPYTFGQTITLANEGERVWFRNTGLAKGFSKSFSDYYQFVITGTVAASGNVMSLLDKSYFPTTFPDDGGDIETPEGFYYFINLFSGCTSLTSAPELPATKLTPYCYQWMFNGCTGLTEAPELPATTLSDWCYSAMFEGCTGLEKAPALPATTLESNCYAAMFRGCTGLTEAPELPATSLAGGCYAEMFRNCTSLETAPTLPATTLVLSCYDQMFRGCTKLNRMRVAFTDWTNNTTYNWLDGVASTGTFASPAELDKTQRGASYIPENWMTVQYSCTIAVGSSDGSKGTVSGGGTFMYGDKVTLTATPAEGCAFKQWSDGTTANPYVFTATEDVTLTATFVKVYEVQATSQNENEGSVSGSGIYEEGTEVTLTATPAENYVFEKWSDGTTANPYVFTPTKDVTLTALFKEYTRYFTDGTEYTATESKFLPEVIYTRTFDNTEWQALYVPFSMDYDEWSEKYEIAKIHNFIEYDDDDNGEFDRTYLVVLKLTSGSTKPNYPYLIRAKETGTHSLVLQDKTLEAAEITSIDCRSVENEYTFTGTYTPIEDMYDNGYYAMSGGALKKANTASVNLNPQRWYMELTSRTGGSASTKAQSIQILVDGEEGIETPSNSPEGGEPVAYDLMGRMVSPTTNVRGVNIVNGKKLIK